MEKILELKNLRTYYSTGSGIAKAVDGVSFSLGRNSTLGVVGESGCGKSVTALSIMRLVPMPPGYFAGGEIFWKGSDLLKLSEENMRQLRGNEIAMIFQEPMSSLNPVFTCGSQIMEQIRIHREMNHAEAKSRSIELLHLVGIPNPAQRFSSYPHELSGGMRQRVMIAMALSCNPALLIADEPTTALDVTVQAQILKLLRDMQKEFNMAIILITHDLGVVAEFADRVNVMYAGKNVEEAPVHDLYYKPAHPYTLGLLRSIPRVDQIDTHRLQTIPGQPPSLINLPMGCAFAPRCPYKELVPNNLCTTKNPELSNFADNHLTRCHLTHDQIESVR